MHHMTGDFQKGGVYCSDPQYAKRGGGGGGNCTLQALYPPPYGIYLLNGDGIKPSFGVGGREGRSYPPPNLSSATMASRLRRVYQTTISNSSEGW